MAAPGSSTTRARLNLDDSLRLVHDILDEDQSFLEYLHDENLSERDRLHHQLQTPKAPPPPSIRPEHYINDTCHELQHDLQQIESELYFYDSMKQKPSSANATGRTRRGSAALLTTGTARPTQSTRQPGPAPKARAANPSNPTIATSFDSLLAKLQRDYEHDQTAHVAAQSRIQARVVAAHKGAMVFGDLQTQPNGSLSQPTVEDPSCSSRQDNDRPWSKLPPPNQPPNPPQEPSRLRSTSMQALRDACSTAIDQKAEAAVLDDRHKQAQAVESVLERSQIRKRLAVAKLQEVCDRDTHDVVEATKAELGQEHHAELAAVQDEWMAKRRHELNEVLVDSERRLDREKKNVAEKFQLETDVKRAALQRELEVDRASALREIEQTFQGDLEALEDRLRHVVAEELQAKRQQVATALLVREEELLQQGRTQALAMHQANEHADVAKLQDALQMGSKLRLQQLRDRLDGQRAAKLAEIERVANDTLERSLEQLRNEHDGETNTQVHATQDRLRQVHDREVESLRQALAIDETRSLNDVTAQLRTNHLQRVQRIRDDHERQRSERLVQLQQTYEAEYLLRMEVLEDELNAKLTADMNDRAADHAHALQKQVATCKQHFADLTTRLSSEMRIFFQVSNNPTISSRSNERNRQPNESKEADVVAKLHTLGVTSRDVHKWVHELSSEYYDLCDQHEVLVESLRQASAQTSTWKQKAATNEVALTRLQAKLDKAIADVHDKTRLCQRLYKANEQLLKQLPTSPP